MVSTAFLLDVIVYGLIAAVVVPSIDLIVFSMRSSSRTARAASDLWIGAGVDRGTDAGPTVRHIPGGHAATTRSDDARRNDTRSDDNRRGRMPAAVSPGAPRMGNAGDPARGAGGTRAARSRCRVNAPAGYVASNGIIITPNMRMVRGSAHLSAASAKFSGASAHCPGASDFLPAASAHLPGASDFFPAASAHLPADSTRPGPAAVDDPPGHPHAEYWRYGSALFYDSF